MKPPQKPGRGQRRKWLRRLRLYYLRQFPRRKKMHGGMLHRLLGERLFDPRLWKPERQTVAAGLAVGTIIGLLPTFYLQILLGLIFAYLLRVNVTATVMGTLVTNPLTTAPIVLLQYRLGLLVVGRPSREELDQFPGILRYVLGHGGPYMAGSVISALVAGLIAYIAALFLWDGFMKLETKALSALERRKLERQSHGPASPPAETP